MISHNNVGRIAAVLMGLLPLLVNVNAQTADPTPSPTPSPAPTRSPAPVVKPSPISTVTTKPNLLRDVWRDQKEIWSSPFRIRSKDLKWLAPWAATTAVLLATDRRTSERISTQGSLPGFSRAVSRGGSNYSTAGIATGMYLFGRATGNKRLRETGRLAGEALIDTYVVTKVSKLALGRRRPNEDDGRGRFFRGGQSFFSGHSSQAWALASVVACQYDRKPWAKYGAYAAATAISLSRLSGRKHFLSDIFVGGSVGYAIGKFVCRSRRSTVKDETGAETSLNSGFTPILEPRVDRRTGSVGGRLVINF